MVTLPATFDDVVNRGISGVEINCPRCFQRKPLKHAKSRVYYVANFDKERNVWWIGICGGCDQRFLVANAGQAMFPPQLVPKENDIPDAVMAARSEALRCLQIGCYEASVLMTRRALELATAQKYPGIHSLADRISKLVEDGTLPARRDFSEAELLAKLGNEGNHAHDRLYKGHEDGLPLAQDAVIALDKVLLDLYRNPSKLQAMKAQLEASFEARRLLAGAAKPLPNPVH